jgi:hypothetical protein
MSNVQALEQPSTPRPIVIVQQGKLLDFIDQLTQLFTAPENGPSAAPEFGPTGGRCFIVAQ